MKYLFKNSIVSMFMVIVIFATLTWFCKILDYDLADYQLETNPNLVIYQSKGVIGSAVSHRTPGKLSSRFKEKGKNNFHLVYFLKIFFQPKFEKLTHFPSNFQFITIKSLFLLINLPPPKMSIYT